MAKYIKIIKEKNMEVHRAAVQTVCQCQGEDHSDLQDQQKRSDRKHRAEGEKQAVK